MAYRNLVKQTAASQNEMLCNIRDFICSRVGSFHDYSATGLNWTLHDSSYAVDESNLSAGDWWVVKSIGEDSNQNMYFRFEYTSTTQLSIRGYLYWNNSSHSGAIASAIVTFVLGNSTTANDLWIYGDLNNLLIIYHQDTGYYYPILCGKIESEYDDTATTATANITAGSSVVVTMTSVPSTWEIDDNIVFRANYHIERATITAISGNDVTFATIANDYDAATTKIQQDLCVVCGCPTDLFDSHLTLINHAGSVWAAAGDLFGLSPSFSDSDGDSLKNDFVTTKAMWGYSGESSGFVSTILTRETAFSGTASETPFSLGTDTYRYFEVYAGGLPLCIKEV